MRPVDSVFTKDSKPTPSIGLCDVLLGAVLETWQHKAHREAKHELRRLIGEHLGWPPRGTPKPGFELSPEGRI